MSDSIKVLVTHFLVPVEEEKSQQDYGETKWIQNKSN